MKIAILSESDFCPKYYDGTTIRLDSILNEFEQRKSEIVFIKLGAKSKCDKFESVSFSYPSYHLLTKNIKFTRNFYFTTWSRLYWFFRKEEFDFILVEGIWGSLYSTALSALNKHHSWIDSVGYVAYNRADLANSGKALLKIDALRKRLFERFLSVFIKNVSVVSKFDKDFIGVNKIAVAPNGVDNEFIRVARNITKPKKILYFANFNGYMNRASLSSLDSEGFVAFLRKYEFEFYIGGLGSKNAFRDLKFLIDDGICLGPQKNIENLYEQYDIFIAPMKGGTGIKNSVLQALAGNMIVLMPEQNLSVYGNTFGLIGYSNEIDLLNKLADLRCGSFYIDRKEFMLSRYTWSSYVERLISSGE